MIAAVRTPSSRINIHFLRVNSDNVLIDSKPVAGQARLVRTSLFIWGVFDIDHCSNKVGAGFSKAGTRAWRKSGTGASPGSFGRERH